MKYTLPSLKQFLNHNLVVLKSSKRAKYALAALIDFTLIVLIILFGKQPAQNFLISPLASSLHSVYSSVAHQFTQESFAFVPGLARNKFEDIDLEGLTALSFFDVPLGENGEINYDSRGYNSFISDEASELFNRAKEKQVKIFMTISAWEKDVIHNLLDSKSAQKKLAEQVVAEIKDANINGVTVDFEYPNGEGEKYKQKFTQFISFLIQHIHSEIPQAQVSVAIPNNLTDKKSIYDIQTLSKISDRIFLIASDFIVPEVIGGQIKNPKFGFNEKEYFEKVLNLLSNLFKKLPSAKVVIERAWYGNGDKYPLYQPNSQPPKEDEKRPASIFVDSETVERLAAWVPAKGRQAARKYIPLIAKALENEGILDSNVLAYALATIEHETDETFEPLEEIQGRFSARRRGYEGGMNYFGRGFIQLTHLRNYKAVGQRIGMGDELVKHPELAGTPEVAAKILAAFFKDNNVANLASRGQFVAARRPINPDINGWNVARLAWKYDATQF